MQSNRQFEILYILLNKKTVTARELAEQLGVSTRTIYRDIDTLSTAGIPVYTEKGKGGGISLLPDFVLNKSLLSEQEQYEILSALHGLSNVRDVETDHILRKLSNVFNKTAENWLEIDYTDWGTSDDFFRAFKTAILERRIVTFDYYNSYGSKTFRRVEPIQLWFKSRMWYIKGFCLTKQAIRLYKLLRVKNLVVTDEVFDKRDINALYETPPETPQAPPENPDIVTKLHIAPEMAYRVYDHFDDQMVEKQTDGSFIATAIWREDNWVHGFILSFGEYIEVLEPQHLRETIYNKALKITKKYIN